MNSVMLEFVHHTQINTHLTHTQWPVCLQQQLSSIPSPLTLLETLVAGTPFVNRTRRLWLGQSGAKSDFCLFISSLYRRLKEETCYCSPDRMFCPLRLAHSYLSIPHTGKTLSARRQLRQYAKHRKKKKEKNLNRLDLLGSRLEQSIMGPLTPLAF